MNEDIIQKCRGLPGVGSTIDDGQRCFADLPSVTLALELEVWRLGVSGAQGQGTKASKRDLPNSTSLAASGLGSQPRDTDNPHGRDSGLMQNTNLCQENSWHSG
jgi:hypothetical protein